MKCRWWQKQTHSLQVLYFPLLIKCSYNYLWSPMTTVKSWSLVLCSISRFHSWNVSSSWLATIIITFIVLRSIHIWHVPFLRDSRESLEWGKSWGNMYCWYGHDQVWTWLSQPPYVVRPKEWQSFPQSPSMRLCKQLINRFMCIKTGNGQFSQMVQPKNAHLQKPPTDSSWHLPSVVLVFLR